MDKRAVQADTFKELRLTAGLTQADVAAALDVSRMRVSQWESGDFTLTIAQLQRFAQVMEMPLALLLRELDYDLGEPLSFEEWRRQRKERLVGADRLHNTLRRGAHNRHQDGVNPSDDQGSDPLIHSYVRRSRSA